MPFKVCRSVSRFSSCFRCGVQGRWFRGSVFGLKVVIAKIREKRNPNTRALEFRVQLGSAACTELWDYIPLVSREWKNGSTTLNPKP